MFILIVDFTSDRNCINWKTTETTERLLFRCVIARSCWNGRKKPTSKSCFCTVLLVVHQYAYEKMIACIRIQKHVVASAFWLYDKGDVIYCFKFPNKSDWAIPSSLVLFYPHMHNAKLSEGAILVKSGTNLRIECREQTKEKLEKLFWCCMSTTASMICEALSKKPGQIACSGQSLFITNVHIQCIP